jgi:hypothetical protein
VPPRLAPARSHGAACWLLARQIIRRCMPLDSAPHFPPLWCRKCSRGSGPHHTSQPLWVMSKFSARFVTLG